MRQETSRAITADLGPWLREKPRFDKPRDQLTEASRYPRSRWEGVIRFLDNSRIAIESNAVECSTDRKALNRMRSSQALSQA